MKKVGLVLVSILAISIVLAGCESTLTNSTVNTSLENTNTNNLKQSIQVNSDNEVVNNLFFFKDDISLVNYNGKFSFNEFTNKDVKLQINEVASLKHGKLYELRLDLSSVNGASVDRSNLGYFYVQQDKIYKILPTQENFNKLKTSEELPKDSVIVCQEKEVKDTIGKEELGWHHYISVDGDTCKYNSYNNMVSSGYYESFTWEKNKGFISYRSGYGAEKDSIEIEISNNGSNVSSNEAKAIQIVKKYFNAKYDSQKDEYITDKNLSIKMWVDRVDENNLYVISTHPSEYPLSVYNYVYVDISKEKVTKVEP